ncbi:DUF3617 domain-containing protein [Caenispirillum bisanense]|uniref:DUF3617 domain-containing protein n=1 Tax=Caenispirillum bisanense TaxID=414052 RepID=UPI0031D9693D
MPGETWQVSTAMTMEGMAMPPQVSQVCLPKGAGAEAAPKGVPADQDCRLSDSRTVGATTTMTIVCSGPEPMTGTIESTVEGPDAYRTVMKMEMEGVPVTVTSSGRRLGQPCEAAAP